MICSQIQLKSGLRLFQVSRTFYTGSCLLAGHSKWANIRHTKAARDREMSVIFNRYARQMRLAIQEGGSPNPKLNSQLQSLIDQAIKHKMPMGTIQNVIKKYSDPANSAKLVRFIQDMKALGKVQMIAVLVTENPKGTIQNMANFMKKFAGTNYDNCRSMFDERGVIEATIPDKFKDLDEAALEEACTDDAIECGAEEVEVVDFAEKIVTFACNPVELERIKRSITERGYSIDFAGPIFVPKMTVKLTPAEIETLEKLKAKLKEVEGVEEFFDNVDYS
ncbi:probable transcriptional regulatory protein Kole_1935 [Culicoides brevitarsis]|uniref:probable transcriptional regulatory protein Kole_1935 n=1 Tax=Culicoides brevitarsis TaxID=469753 RepID=UPI00307C5BD4